MQMISQAARMWAVAVTYTTGAEADSEDETAVSARMVVGWQLDPEAEGGGDRHAVLVPLITWIDGILCSTDGSITTPNVDMAGTRSVIAYGETRNDATKIARNLASNALPGWRRSEGVADQLPTTDLSASERASQTAGRAQPGIPRPNELTILAARHLDAIEGPVQIGRALTADDRSAINAVLRYVARAHNAGGGS